MVKLLQDVSQTFGLDKTESETTINPADLPQSASEQEGSLECSTIQNDHKVSISELDDTSVQLNKETDSPQIQYATEFNAVSNLYNFFIYDI